MYNDKLVYKVVISVSWGYFMKREGSFKIYLKIDENTRELRTMKLTHI